MKVKIDTRERFHVITIEEPAVSANMTEQMDTALLPLLDDPIKNVILSLKDTQKLDNAAAAHVLHLQNRFYDAGASFVVCELHADLKKTMQNTSLFNKLNYAPTESEAMDIVQMEEIERELGEN